VANSRVGHDVSPQFNPAISTAVLRIAHAKNLPMPGKPRNLIVTGNSLAA
jgi:hypothetical protein